MNSNAYGLLRFTAPRATNLSHLDLRATAKAIESEFPNASRSIQGWIVTVREVVERIEKFYTEQEGLFLLARTMKGHLKSEFKLAEHDVQEFVPYAYLFRDMMSFTDQIIRSFNRGGMDFEDDYDLELLFENAWLKAKFGEGDTLLNLAKIHAELVPDTKFPGLTNPRYRLVLGMAEYFHLNRPNGITAFLLPQDEIGKVLGYRQQAVSLVIDILKSKGYLKLVSGANHLGGKAATYSFHASPRKARKTAQCL